MGRKESTANGAHRKAHSGQGALVNGLIQDDIHERIKATQDATDFAVGIQLKQ